MKPRFFAYLFLFMLVFLLMELLVRLLIFYGYNLGIINYYVFSSVVNSLKGFNKNILLDDDKLIYKYAPNVDLKIIDTEDHKYKIKTTDIGFDDIGFRDDGISGEIFAVVVGDSFTACIGVDYEYCWVELLEKELGCDFVNMGVEGYSSIQKLIILKDYALKLNPKLIIFDINLTDPPDDFFFANNMKRPIPHPINRFYQKGIEGYLASYSLLKFFLDEIKGYDVGQKFRDYISKYGYGITYTILSVEEAYNIASDSGIPFILVLFHHIKPIIDFAEQRNIPFIDLQKNFEKRGLKNLYLPRDGHLNVQGNKATFEVIYDFLKDRGFDTCLRKS